VTTSLTNLNNLIICPTFCPR